MCDNAPFVMRPCCTVWQWRQLGLNALKYNYNRIQTQIYQDTLLKPHDNTLHLNYLGSMELFFMFFAADELH